MQALQNLTIMYTTFEQAGAHLEVEISVEDLFFADVRLAEARQHQERLQGELKSTRESLDMALMDMKESHNFYDPVQRAVITNECPGVNFLNTTGCSTSRVLVVPAQFLPRRRKPCTNRNQAATVACCLPAV